MTGRKITSIYMFLFMILFTPIVVNAGIVGKGRAQIINNNEGAAKKQALNNALRDAVMQGAGLFLESETDTKNFMVVRDEIFSSARGFVKSYKVLREEKEGDSWVVEIDAQIAASDIKSKLEELRILHQKMGNKRLMVIYNPTDLSALQSDHSAVSAATISIESDLLEYGFRIFDSRSVGYVFDRISQKGAAVEEWVKIASQHQVDILIEYQLMAEKKKTYSKYAIRAARTTLHAKAYDVSTGRKIASKGTNQKQMTNARMGSYDWNNALSKASIKAGKVVSEEISKDIVKYYEMVGDIGNAFFMVFKGFSKDEEFEILEILENLEGYQSLSELKKSPEYFEIEYFSSMGKSRLERKLYLDCKTKGIKFLTKEMTGNRYIFVKR